MKKKNQYLALSLISLMLLAISCNELKYEDDKNPVILKVELNKDEVTLGDTLYISYTFEDDKDLTSYKVDIRPSFERVDTTTSPLDLTLVVGGFSYKNSQNVSIVDTVIIRKKTTFKDEKKNQPVTPGEYTLEVFCIDWVGKKAESYTKILKINSLPEDTIVRKKLE